MVFGPLGWIGNVINSKFLLSKVARALYIIETNQKKRRSKKGKEDEKDYIKFTARDNYNISNPNFDKNVSKVCCCCKNKKGNKERNKILNKLWNKSIDNLKVELDVVNLLQSIHKIKACLTAVIENDQNDNHLIKRC